jgi:ATPase
MAKEAIEKLAPDTSVIIEGVISQKIEKGEYQIKEIIIHEAVLAELEHQANEGKAIGHIGLDEIERIKHFLGERIRFAGARPKYSEIKYASLGEIDALIRQLAYEEDATLITADKVQYKIAKAKEMKCIFIHHEKEIRKIKLESYFDATTMSVHLREGMPPTAKKGQPGNWQFVKLTNDNLVQEEIKEISREILEEARISSEGFIEIERPGSTIIQLGMYRIVITRPPFSDGWEITAVKPVKQMHIEEYKLSEKLYKRICEHAEGILIAGAPGMGKSTFAAALTIYYSQQGKIVKTIEAPRDLVLPNSITQLAISHGTPQEVHDILLLSRPDYTLFDEMRNTDDFALYADLRLAGIGLAGVVHGTTPVDAIQRFVGRIELGVIPQVIDTVIFIKNGAVSKVLSLKMEIKVPTGMTEADLARPVVVVRDFETGTPEYELYSYGEETVLIPISDVKTEERGVNKIAKESIKRKMEKYADKAVVEISSPERAIVYVPENNIASIIGKQGKHIEEIEKEIGISLDIRELEEKKRNNTEERCVNAEIEEDKHSFTFILNKEMKNKDVTIYAGGEPISRATAGKKATVRISKNSAVGERIERALKNNSEIKVN